jgi:ATP-dependent RNA helicase RhlE
MPFTKFSLSDPLVQGILATGYTAPTEIQSKAIPAAVSGKDVIGCAQTGTGKTAAYVLPILNRLSHEPPTDVESQTPMDRRTPRRSSDPMILTDRRELAAQVEASIREYGRFTSAAGRGHQRRREHQWSLAVLRRGVDIVHRGRPAA